MTILGNELVCTVASCTLVTCIGRKSSCNQSNDNQDVRDPGNSVKDVCGAWDSGQPRE